MESAGLASPALSVLQGRNSGGSEKNRTGVIRLHNLSIGLERLDVDGLFASLGFHDLKGDLVIFLKPEKTKLFDAGVVHENFADLFRSDEPIPLFRVVPFDTTFCHEISPFEMPCAKAQEVIWEGDPLESACVSPKINSGEMHKRAAFILF
jgi:hypothetical protein